MWVNVRKNLIEKMIAKEEIKRTANYFSISFLCVLIAILILKIFVFDAVVVSGTSMCQTLASGDVLLVNKLDKPERGDIVLFYAGEVNENGNIEYHLDADGKKQFYIKRIIAYGNETVYWRNGTVSIKTLDGTVVDLIEPYVNGETYSYHLSGNNLSGVLVPENHFFVMGDNRPISNDSRGSIGTVDERLILGTVPDFIVNNKDSFLRHLFKVF